VIAERGAVATPAFSVFSLFVSISDLDCRPNGLPHAQGTIPARPTVRGKLGAFKGRIGGNFAAVQNDVLALEPLNVGRAFPTKQRQSTPLLPEKTLDGKSDQMILNI
jgi:hypothetical protein